MKTIQEQDGSAAGSCHLLFRSSVLRNVLSYVSLGQYLFAAPISKWWRDVYMTLESLQAAYAESSCKSIAICIPQITLYSAAFASPAILRLAHQQGLDSKSASLAYHRAAAKHADVATLAAAHKLGLQYTAMTMSCAARCNRLAEVQYLHRRGCPWPARLFEVVASSGCCELLRWCHEHGCPMDVHIAPYFTAQSGNIELMAWVMQLTGAQLSAEAMCAAASKGRTAMCQYLHTQQCPWAASSTSAAALGGHVDLLTWLLDNGCPWKARPLCVTAARSGCVKVLEYLQQLGLLSSPQVLRYMLSVAALNQKLAAAQWLRAQGAEWPYVHETHPWRGELLTWAVDAGFTELLVYI
jgi:hypothetical protein